MSRAPRAPAGSYLVRTLPGRAVQAVHLTCMKTETNPLSGLDPLLSINELAEYLGVPIKTIY